MSTSTRRDEEKRDTRINAKPVDGTNPVSKLGSSFGKQVTSNWRTRSPPGFGFTKREFDMGPPGPGPAYMLKSTIGDKSCSMGKTKRKGVATDTGLDSPGPIYTPVFETIASNKREFLGQGSTFGTGHVPPNKLDTNDTRPAPNEYLLPSPFDPPTSKRMLDRMPGSTMGGINAGMMMGCSSRGLGLNPNDRAWCTARKQKIPDKLLATGHAPPTGATQVYLDRTRNDWSGIGGKDTSASRIDIHKFS